MINEFESVHDLLGNKISQVINPEISHFIFLNSKVKSSPLHPAQAAELPEGVVARESVVSAPLEVEGHKVHSKAIVPRLEQVVCDLFSENIVRSLTGLG